MNSTVYLIYSKPNRFQHCCRYEIIFTGGCHFACRVVRLYQWTMWHKLSNIIGENGKELAQTNFDTKLRNSN
jgi:hypothetical protein